MELSHQSRFLSTLDLILRVPPLFIMDSILNSSPDEHNSKHFINYTLNLTLPESNILSLSESFIAHLTQSMGWILLSFSGFILSFSTLILPTNNLVSIYLWLSSIGLIIWSYICNEEFVRYINNRNTRIALELVSLNLDPWIKCLGNYLLQLFLGTLFVCALFHRQPLISSTFVFIWKCFSLCFMAPTLLSLIGIPPKFLAWTPRGCALLALFYVILCLISRFKHVVSSTIVDIKWSYDIVRHYGLYTLLENQWLRLQIPQVLMIFWISRFTEQAVLIVADAAYQYYNNSEDAKFPFNSEFINATIKHLLVRGCETVIAVLGMTSIVSSLSNQFGHFMESFLLVDDPDERNIGTISALLFLILALQTGLTGMDPEKRFLRLYRNLCLLFSAILNIVHNMVNPVLMSLSASRNPSITKHSRALIVCLFLIVCPQWFLYCLWTQNTLSTWLLAVTCFTFEVILKVIITLIIYCLFMIDAFRTTMWEKLDDYVYYIRATGNMIDFLFGIIIFLNGAWIIAFESGSILRALTMCIHAYFNIWCQAKLGLETFMRRRLAVRRISSLPQATKEQLEMYDDVCAICYQNLNHARVTHCRHFYHELCLQKWLYVQDCCPMCHNTLHSTSESGEDSATIESSRPHQD